MTALRRLLAEHPHADRERDRVLQSADAVSCCPRIWPGDPPNLRQVVAHTAEIGLRGQIPPVAGATASHLEPERLSHAARGRHLRHRDLGQPGILPEHRRHAPRRASRPASTITAARWSAYRQLQLRAGDVPVARWCCLRPRIPIRTRTATSRWSPATTCPGIPRHRLKARRGLQDPPRMDGGRDRRTWSAALLRRGRVQSAAPDPGLYGRQSAHLIQAGPRTLEIFASIDNLLNRKYATWGS